MCRFSIRKMGIFGFKIEKRGNGEYEEKTVISYAGFGAMLWTVCSGICGGQ